MTVEEKKMESLVPTISLPPIPAYKPPVVDDLPDVANFPDPIAESRKMPLWGVELTTEKKRSKRSQPSLMARTGYTSTHYYAKRNEEDLRKQRLMEGEVFGIVPVVKVTKGGDVIIPGPEVDVERRNLKKWTKAQLLYTNICKPEYRSGSVENALWGLSIKDIGREVFVQSIVSEFKFDRKLRMEEHLTHLYNGFEGATLNRVDYRLIFCTYLNLMLFKVIIENPRHLFFLMYDIFTEPFSDVVERRDVLNLISLASCSEDEFRATRGRLNSALTELAPRHGLKPNFRLVEKKFLAEVFETTPGLLISFKEQCWARLSEEQRLYILGKKEDESAKGFEYQDYKFKARQALQLWTKAILAKSFRTWDEYKEESLRIKSQRLWMLYRSAKRRLRQWRIRTELKLAKRERVKIARAMGKLIVKRARFLRWSRLVIFQRRMLRACHRFDNKFKRYGDGLGHLRYGWWRWKARLMLQQWDNETKGLARVEYALKWQLSKFKHRVWKAFKTYIKQKIVEKNRELDMIDRQKWLAQVMGDADVELKELKKKKEAEMLAKQIAEEEAEARERIKNRNLQNMRKKAERGANDRYIKEIQREERRKRVEVEKQRIIEEWKDEWDGENVDKNSFNPKRTKYRKRLNSATSMECYRCGREGHFWRQCYFNEHVNGVYVYDNTSETLEDIAKKFKITKRQLCKWNHVDSHEDMTAGQNVMIMNIDDGNWHARMDKEPGNNWTWDMVDVCRQRVDNWLNSKDKEAKEKLMKNFKNLRREFYMPPTIENTYREAQLNSEASIALSIIDGMMFSKGVLGRELFEAFDKSGDGYITYEEFQHGIDELGLEIEHSWVRSIVKAIDKEGDGFISVKELEEAMKKTYEFNGIQGSPWKMYVSIAHQILVFHDVVSDEMIFEHDMTNKKLKQIVKANILAEKEVTERDLILTMKAKDLKDRQEYYAATKLQFFYWKWTALRDMAKQRWKLEQHELSLMRKKEKKYALLWQTAWRKYLAKKVSWFRVQMHFQKIVEIENGRGVVYYYNHLTGDKTLTKPKVFWLLLNRRMGEDIDDPLPWSLQYDDEGRQYWFNHTDGSMNLPDRYDDGFDIHEIPAKKPSGYKLCGSCNIELAWKHCKSCDYGYCFNCFRVNHNFVGADRHKWEMCEAVMCGLCKKNVAAKRAKGKDFCENCFGRLEKSGVFRGKAVGKIEDV